MKITFLCDNNTLIGKPFLGEPGLSFFIEDEGTKILFDTGLSDVYLKNAEKLGIDLKKTDMIVLSHGHNDHTGGLEFFPYMGRKIPLLTCEGAFSPKRKHGKIISCPVKEDTLRKNFDVKTVSSPVKISKNITFLGKIERNSSFENKMPVGETFLNNRWQEDFVEDDSALMYEKDDGIFIITACSHAGICNIISHAKKVSGKSKVSGVAGGFHLLGDCDEQAEKTGEFLKEENIPFVCPCHCTSLRAKIILSKYTDIKEAGAGTTFEI